MYTNQTHAWRTGVVTRAEATHPNGVDPAYFSLGHKLKLIFSQPGRKRLNVGIGLLQLGFVVSVLNFIVFDLLVAVVLDLV